MKTKSLVRATLLIMLLLANLCPCLASAPRNGARLRTIWDYQTELGLSDDQVAQLKSTLKSLQDQLAGLQLQISAEERSLKSLVDTGASRERIRGSLERVARLQVDMRMADIDTSRALDEILEDEQTQKWKKIQRGVTQGR